MSKLLELLLGSVLIAVFSVAFVLFSALHYIFRDNHLSDCVWQGTVKTWIDANGDGHLNGDEPPLRGIQVYIDELPNDFMDMNWPLITGKDGDVQFSVSIPGCSDALYEIYVSIPQGYRTTTRTRIEVHPDVRANPGSTPVYYFGLVPDE